MSSDAAGGLAEQLAVEDRAHMPSRGRRGEESYRNGSRSEQYADAVDANYRILASSQPRNQWKDRRSERRLG